MMNRSLPVLALLLTLLAVPATAAQEDPFDVPGAAAPTIVVAADASLAPAVSVDEAMPRYAPRDPAADPKDPFGTLIEPPVPTVPAVAPTPDRNEKRTPPPLPLKVQFIVGNANDRMALIDLNGQSYELRAGEAEQGGLFKVLEIGDDKVTVYDSRVQKNREVPIGE